MGWRELQARARLMQEEESTIRREETYRQHAAQGAMTRQQMRGGMHG